MPIDPQVLLMALSALASTLSLASSTKNLMKEDNISADDAIEKLRRQDNPAQRDSLRDISLINTAKSLLVIPQDLLDHLAERVNDCIKRHIEESKRTKSIAGEQQADRNAQECVCNALRRIKSFNKGRLPNDKNLMDLWKAYGCKP